MKLQPNPKNPRTISKEDFDKLKAKIKRNPDGLKANKIVYKMTDETNGIIIAGNQRFRAILDLKLEQDPEWFLDATDWSEEQLKEYLIISNISDGRWDWDILANEWDMLELKDWGLDMPNTDFNTDEQEFNSEEDIKTTNKCPSCSYEW